MPSPNKIKQFGRIIQLLSALWYTMPELRFIQLIHFVVSQIDVRSDGFYIEDDVLEAKLKELLENTNG